MVQLYVPLIVWAAVAADDDPGLMLPLSYVPLSRTMRCVVTSLFVQATESPEAMVTGFGLNAPGPTDPTMLMVLVAGAPRAVRASAAVSAIERVTVMRLRAPHDTGKTACRNGAPAIYDGSKSGASSYEVRRQRSWKLTVTVMSTGTGTPSRSVGSNVHADTAAIAGMSRYAIARTRRAG